MRVLGVNYNEDKFYIKDDFGDVAFILTYRYYTDYFKSLKPQPPIY